MWRLTFILIPFIVGTTCQMFITGQWQRERRWLLALCTLLAAVHFGLQSWMVQTMTYPFVGAKFLHDISAVLLLPFAHLLVCYGMGITQELRFFRGMIWLSALLLPDLVLGFANILQPHELSVADYHNYLCITVWPGVDVRLQMYSVIIVLQSLVEMNRIGVMRRILKVRGLQIKPMARVVVITFYVACVWILLAALPSYGFLSMGITADVKLISYSILLSTLMVMIVKFFDDGVLVGGGDVSEVNMEEDPDRILGAAIEKLIEEEHIYLNGALHIEELAYRLSTNRTYVARAIKAYYGGRTFTEVMNQARVEHAKGLMLADAHRRLEDVAASSGFSSASFFARVFKALEGQTPTQWRTAQGALREAQPHPAEGEAHGLTTDEALQS